MLAAAILVPVATAAFAAWRSWENVWHEARQEISRSADAVAEYARRIFDAQRLVAERADDLIRGLSDEEIRVREAEIHRAFADLARGAEMARIVLATSRDGMVLASSSTYPVPPTSGADREWAVALRNPAEPEPHISAVHVSRLDGRMFLALTIRRGHARARTAPPGPFDGLVQVTSGPDEIASGFATLLEQQEDITALVRADGNTLASLPAFTAPPPPLPADTEFRRVSASGAIRGFYFTTSRLTQEPTLYALRRAGDYPVYAVVGRRVSTIHADWLSRFAGLLIWAMPAMLCLLAAALYARRRVQAAEAVEAALRTERMNRAVTEAREAAEARFRTVFDSDVMGMLIFEPGTGATFAINNRMLAMKGRSRADFAQGRVGWGESTPPEHREADARARAQAVARGWWDPYEKEYLRPDGTRLPVRLFSAPLPGEPGLIIVMVEDISRQRAAERRRDLVLREVQHRARNSFALLRSMVNLSHAESAEALADALDGRIQALARATALLSRPDATEEDGAELEALIRAALAPFLPQADGTAQRIALSGVMMRLDPRIAQPLAMMLHELATNAAKYGALSRPDGHVSVTWAKLRDQAGRAALQLVWAERGAPPRKAPPAQAGFGFLLIDNVVSGQLDGEVQRDWRPEGLLCTLVIPLEEEDQPGGLSSPGTGAGSPSVSRT